MLLLTDTATVVLSKGENIPSISKYNGLREVHWHAEETLRASTWWERLSYEKHFFTDVIDLLCTCVLIN